MGYHYILKQQCANITSSMGNRMGGTLGSDGVAQFQHEIESDDF